MIDPLTPPPFEIAVDCNGERHWVRVLEGMPHAMAHESEAEQALGILGARLPACLRYVDAVRRAPRTLARLEKLYLRPEYCDRLGAAWSALSSGLDLEKKYGEPRIDVLEIPYQFRVLAMLGRARTELEGLATRREELESLIKSYAALLVAHSNAIKGIAFEIGGPGVDMSSPRQVVFIEESRGIVRLAPDWLSTVLALGLTEVGGRFTLGATPEEDGTATITQLVTQNDRVVGSERKTVPLPDGVRLLGQEARA